MDATSASTLPRKRVVHRYVREDGADASSLLKAYTESDSQKLCKICGRGFKSNRQANTHLKSHGDAEQRKKEGSEVF